MTCIPIPVNYVEDKLVLVNFELDLDSQTHPSYEIFYGY